MKLSTIKTKFETILLTFELKKSEAAVPLHKTLIYEIEPDCKYHTFATINAENL